MEPVLRKQKSKYDLLEFKRGKDIPYIRGIRVDNLYVMAYGCWGLSIEEISKDRDLPEEVIRQAIDWCTKNDNLITKILAKERREAGIKD